jgi:menaquinone-dependent protoporphyrinogen oxidase
MKVLVAYATQHGATRGISERIGQRLQARGLDVTVRPARDVGHPSDYDAFVIGSAAYMFHWLSDATTFVRHHRFLLAERPVWLFSSGPLGTDEVDAQGRDVRTASEPREFPEFREAVHPRDERIFFGAYDPGAPPIGLAERLTRLMPAARDALPSGDFRDWAEIEAWAESIADELVRVPSDAVMSAPR